MGQLNRLALNPEGDVLLQSPCVAADENWRIFPVRAGPGPEAFLELAKKVTAPL
jgi:hypothetical protein